MQLSDQATTQNARKRRQSEAVPTTRKESAESAEEGTSSPIRIWTSKNLGPVPPPVYWDNQASKPSFEVKGFKGCLCSKIETPFQLPPSSRQEPVDHVVRNQRAPNSQRIRLKTRSKLAPGTVQYRSVCVWCTTCLCCYQLPVLQRCFRPGDLPKPLEDYLMHCLRGYPRDLPVTPEMHFDGDWKKDGKRTYSPG